MIKLQEIPEFVYSFSGSDIIMWAVGVWIVAAVAFAAYFIRSNCKDYPENSFRSQINWYEMLRAFLIGLIFSLISVLVTSVVMLNSGNSDEMNATAFDNVSEVYNVDLEIEDFKFTYEKKSNSERRLMNEATATYDDLETSTRYDLVFVFKDNKEPVLLKIGNVDDELVSRFKK